MKPAITLRPMTDADLEFSCRVFAGTRDDIAAQDWPEERKDELVRSQFQLQHVYYHQQYPNGQFDVIVSDGCDVGRLYVNREEDDLRIIDIALLPEHRGQGLGGAIMRDLLAEAERNGQPVTIHVEKENPASRLYERLGFQTIQDRGLHDFMQWIPSRLVEQPHSSTSEP